MKRLERLLRLWFGYFAAVLLWRPGRKQRARKLLQNAKRVLLVRIDNRVGEALLTTPLFGALHPRHQVDVLVHQRCARVLEGHPQIGGVFALDRRWLWLGPWAPGIRAWRERTRGAVVVNCASWEEFSGTPALVARLIAPHGCVVGPAIGPGRLLADVCVKALEETTSETQQRLHLLSPLGVTGTAGLSFRTPRESEVSRAALEAMRSPFAIVNPGGRLDYRRVPAEVFIGICQALLAAGRTPLVTWGPGEQPLAAAVVAGAPGAVIAPATNLDELAALMRAAGLTVCNNTGPMHLSVALGVRTIGLFLKMPIERWGHPEAPHQMIDLTPVASSVAQMVERAVQGLRRA
jgi:heptosyltransferase-3